MVLREGFLIPTSEATPDPELEAYLAPFLVELDVYNSTPIGQTEAPIDGSLALFQETNSANLQADSAVFQLAQDGIAVDMHLSGAMTDAAIAAGASVASPVNLTKGDMFTLMKYENSLVVIEMTGTQIKPILERGYRNYWYYNYDIDNAEATYTTCMLTTDSGNVITYDEKSVVPGDTPPDGDNVVSFVFEGTPVDFTDDVTTYLVSTVNYIAAGSCNFSDAGETIWPLDQIAYDTQYFVRDSVINYVDAQPDPIAPAIEGRLVFLP